MKREDNIYKKTLSVFRFNHVKSRQYRPTPDRPSKAPF